MLDNKHMLKKTIKFIDEEQKEIEFSERVNIIDKDDEPFKKIINNDNYLNYSVVFNNLDEYKIPLEDTFHLRVNVKEAGSFHFFFLSKFFNKSEVIAEVTKLKEQESPREKINLLFNSLSTRNILFVVYDPKGECLLRSNEIPFQENIFIFEEPIVEIEEPPVAVEEEKIEEQALEEVTKVPAVEETKEVVAPIGDVSTLYWANEVKDKLKQSNNERVSNANNQEINEIANRVAQKVIEDKHLRSDIDKTINRYINSDEFINPEKEKREREPLDFQKIKKILADFFDPLIKEKLKFLFIVIASIIMSFTIEIGIFDCYADNKIYFFFFSFSLVGLIFNFIIFKDFFHDKQILKYNDYVFAALSILVGFGAATGLFALFYGLTANKPESLANIGPVVGISIPIFLALEATSIVLGKFIKFNFKKNEEENKE